MTVPLQTQHDIREMDARGAARAEIARGLGVSRNTVAKYADMEDVSPAPPFPAARPRPSLAGHGEWIDSALAADLGAPRKRRHTAKRIYDRLVAERGYSGSYSSVCRHVAEWRAGRAAAGGGFLELEWAPGTAQVDYGNFAAVLAGREVAPKLLVLTLPHPDARFCAAGMSERSECLYEGLAGIFAQIGRAPTALVLDNATEAGRRAAGVVTESELFSRFRAHYRCSSRYCNPYSGHEKRVRRERRGLPGEEPAGPGARGARDEGRLDRELAQVGRAALLVVDELGFPPLDPDGARLLFQVVSEAYERQSVVVTTNLEFSRWGQVSGDDQMAAAVIDRVVHHGRLLQFRGESYRVRHALMQQA